MLCGMAALAAIPAGGNWPGWRGDGSGISGDTALPVFWNAATHIQWKTPLPGEGSSSPIVWSDRVFLTAATESGKKRLLLCLDARDGKMIWQREIVADRVPQTYDKAGYAPATPVTDGQRIYVFFDTPGLLAFDMDGNECWRLPLGPFDSIYNVANSPILDGEKVILCVDHSGDSFIMAVDRATGTPLWKNPRKQDMQFTTPLRITYQGKEQVVVNAMIVKSYDPETGRELWSCGKLNPTVVPSPIFANGLVYATSGRNGPALGIDPGGSGDVTNTRVKMQVAIGGPYVISPLACPLLLLPGDDGNMRFLDDSGKMVVNLRLRAHFTASPIVGGDNIYWTSETGDTFVVDISKLTAPRPSVKLIAKNSLGEKCLASPAVSQGRLFLRTAKALYCLAGAGGATAAPPEAPAPATFEELQQRFAANSEAEGPGVQVRLAAIEAMALLRDPRAVPFLQDAALNDLHWDVSEAAVKALGQQEGPAAVTALCDMFKDGRVYLKASAAVGLGRLQALTAVPALLKGANDADVLVRLACLQALADIAAAHDEAAPPIVFMLSARLSDEDGGIKAAATHALGQLAGKVGSARGEIVTALLRLAADENPLVSEAAREALGEFHLPAP